MQFIKLTAKNGDSVYIGESSKVVGDRVKEHSSNVRRRYQGSLIYKHSNETGHELDFDNPKVLNSSKFTGTRKYLESFYSVADQNSIMGTYPIFWKLFYLWTDSNKICTVYVK